MAAEDTNLAEIHEPRVVMLTEEQLVAVVRRVVKQVIAEEKEGIAKTVQEIFLAQFGRSALFNLLKLAGWVVVGTAILLAGKGVLPK